MRKLIGLEKKSDEWWGDLKSLEGWGEEAEICKGQNLGRELSRDHSENDFESPFSPSPKNKFFNF